MISTPIALQLKMDAFIREMEEVPNQLLQSEIDALANYRGCAQDAAERRSIDRKIALYCAIRDITQEGGA